MLRVFFFFFKFFYLFWWLEVEVVVSGGGCDRGLSVMSLKSSGFESKYQREGEASRAR